MKLALVRRGYSPTGGAEAYLKRFAGALAGAGHELTLYTTPDWPREEWPYGLEAVPAGTPRDFADKLAAMVPGREGTVVFSLERVRACDCFRAGDGVHAAWLERRRKVEPFWKALFRDWQPKHRELLALERGMLGEGGARAVIVNSRMVGEEIARVYGYPREQMHLVYNGVPAALSREEQERARVEVRRELGLGAEEYVVLFAGSGWERKGLAQAIRAVGLAKSRPTLLVAGTGRRRGLPDGETLRFLGGVKGLGRYLAAADAFILPTLYDPFSNACLEAVAAGRPVITTTANGVAEVLGSENGDAVDDPLDVGALAVAVERWADRERRAAAAGRLRAIGAERTVERNLTETLEVILGLGGESVGG